MADDAGMDVVVVGAGIVGLAAAWELQRRGCAVTVLSRDAPGTVQSTGLTRIFRISHDDNELVEAAREALDGWRAWERTFGRPLVDPDGLLITGPAPARLVDRHGAPVAEARHGRLHPYSAWDGEWWFEPTAGTGHIADAVQALAADVAVTRTEVVAAEPGRVELADGRRIEADWVVVCAGVETRTLCGLAPSPQLAYARWSFPVREGAARRAPCWIQRDAALSPSFYAVADGDEHYAIGLSEGAPGALDEAEHLDQSAAALTEVVREVLPGLEPAPTRPVRCVFPWLPGHGGPRDSHDGWDVVDEPRLTAVTGPNLFKFAPVLGRRVATRVCGVGARAV